MAVASGFEADELLEPLKRLATKSCVVVKCCTHFAGYASACARIKDLETRSDSGSLSIKLKQCPASGVVLAQLRCPGVAAVTDKHLKHYWRSLVVNTDLSGKTAFLR